MTKIKILHISDYHEYAKYAQDQKIVRDALITDLSNTEDDFDIAIFSGDLVQAGTSEAEFQSARKNLIDPALSAIKLPGDRFFTCPGNHDVDRELVRAHDYIQTGLTQTLRTRDSINAFIDRHFDLDLSTGQIPDALNRLTAFYQSVWAKKNASCVFVGPFVKIDIIEVDGVKVGICAFNTAWRCTGEADDVDRAHLILGERVVDRSLEIIRECTVKLAVFHHPFDWLVPVDRASVESLLHSKFDAFFFGHVHNVSPQQTQTAAGGAIYSQAGCLYQGRNYYNGYSKVTLNIGEAEAVVEAREYSDRLRAFVPAVGAIPGGKVTLPFVLAASKEGPNLMSILAQVRPGIKRRGDEHMRLTTDDKLNVDLERHFVCPPLEPPKAVTEDDPEKNGADGETADGKANELKENSTAIKYEIEDLLRDSKGSMVIGPSESGKTAFAHFIASRSVLGLDGIPLRLPLIAPFYDFQKGKNPLWRAVRAYANEISDGKLTWNTIKSVPCLIIVDGVVSADDRQTSMLLDIVEENPDIKWILLAEGDGKLANVSTENEKRISQLTVLSIKDLPRSSIRTLSARWLNEKTDAETTGATFKAVMEHIQRSGLPRNGYIVSLILWTLKNGSQKGETKDGEKTRPTQLINEAVLLENIIDFMLGKMDYTGSLRSEFDFTSKVMVLQELAFFLRGKTSSVTKNDIVSQVIHFLRRKGLKYDASKIVEGLIDCGILSQIDEYVSFRYRRFEEYFSAGYLRDNREQFETVTSGTEWLDFSRELDLYTSRYRNESGLLQIARKKVDAIQIPNPNLDGDKLYEYLAAGSTPEVVANSLKKMRREPMTAQKIDELRDRADASVTRRRSALAKRKTSSNIHSNAQAFIGNLDLYTRFIRNLEFADNTDKSVHLQHCFDLWVVHVKLLMSGMSEMFSEMREDILTDPDLGTLDSTEIEKLTKLVENQVKYVIPRFVSSHVYSSIGSEKLTAQIQSLAMDVESEPLKRVIAAFVLLEVAPLKGLEVMHSSVWSDELNKGWVTNLVESKLHQYYTEQHLSDTVRASFERLLATIEGKLVGSQEGKNRVKGRVIQALERKKLLDKDN